jgi:hypothetical protein
MQGKATTLAIHCQNGRGQTDPSCVHCTMLPVNYLLFQTSFSVGIPFPCLEVCFYGMLRHRSSSCWDVIVSVSWESVLILALPLSQIYLSLTLIGSLGIQPRAYSPLLSLEIGLGGNVILPFPLFLTSPGIFLEELFLLFNCHFLTW